MMILCSDQSSHVISRPKLTTFLPRSETISQGESPPHPILLPSTSAFVSQPKRSSVCHVSSTTPREREERERQIYTCVRCTSRRLARTEDLVSGTETRSSDPPPQCSFQVYPNADPQSQVPRQSSCSKVEGRKKLPEIGRAHV